MERKNRNITKQDLLDKLSELADLLSAGRRIDPNCSRVKMQLEAIQSELESLKIRGGGRNGEENGAAMG